jgi:peptidoglycan hydrolase CwlO-like protein
MPDDIVKLILTGLLAALPGLIALFIQRKKTDAETLKTVRDADKVEADVAAQYKQMSAEQAKDIKYLREEIEKIKVELKAKDILIEELSQDLKKKSQTIEQLTRDIEKRDKIIADLLTGIELLYDQLRSNGEIPVWKPTEYKL